MRFPKTVRYRRAECKIYGKSKSYPFYRVFGYVAGKRFSLHSAAIQLTEAAGKLNGHSLAEAVEGFLESVVAVKRISVREGIEQFIAFRKGKTVVAEGRRPQLSAEHWRDGCFVGSAPPLIGPCCHGQDEARVYAQLCRIAEEWIEILETDGRELPVPLGKASDFSGKFVLRLEPALHRRLAAKALAAGESLNSFCVKTLRKA